jgi:radical SAM/Cys-rich protein
VRHVQREKRELLLMVALRKRLPLARPVGPDFDGALRDRGLGALVRAATTTLQINVGKLCNQACHHCHVEAGPKRTEIMPRAIAERLVALLETSPGVTTVDLTGGAPELNPSFRWLVGEVRRLGRHVIDRCNLTVLFEPGMDDMAAFLAAHQVEVVASLPCYGEANVDQQRGRGVWGKSIRALHLLNELGYGRPGSPLRLNLVYNPVGAFLPPPEEKLEAKYHEELGRLFGIEFHRLYTITNMPIRRFADFLDKSGKYDEYMGLLVNHFNPSTVPELMCRSLVSVSWEGRLYDCDFNQMLEVDLGAGVRTVFDLETFEGLAGKPIATGSHCFGCTAGTGSSCGGSLT